MRIGAIWAQSSDGGIGLDGKLPWKVPGELAAFKAATVGTAIAMGYNTYESLPDRKPLPDRLNIVITSKVMQVDGFFFVESLEKAVELAQHNGYKFLSIIGGAKLLESVFRSVDIVRYTLLKNHAFNGECDTFITPFVRTQLDDFFIEKIVEETEHFWIYEGRRLHPFPVPVDNRPFGHPRLGEENVD